MFIRFTVRVFRERSSICVCSYCPFGFEGGIWDFLLWFCFLRRGARGRVEACSVQGM